MASASTSFDASSADQATCALPTCSGTAAFSCSHCPTVRYCSQSHQLADRPRHVVSCLRPIVVESPYGWFPAMFASYTRADGLDNTHILDDNKQLVKFFNPKEASKAGTADYFDADMSQMVSAMWSRLFRSCGW